MLKNSGIDIPLSQQPKRPPPVLKDGITLDTPKNFRVPKRPRPPTPPPPSPPPPAAEAAAAAAAPETTEPETSKGPPRQENGVGRRSLPKKSSVPSKCPPKAPVPSKGQQQQLSSTLAPDAATAAAADPNAIACSEEELEARFEVTPPGSPMPDAEGDDSAWLPDADDPFSAFHDSEIPLAAPVHRGQSSDITDSPFESSDPFASHHPNVSQRDGVSDQRHHNLSHQPPSSHRSSHGSFNGHAHPRHSLPAHPSHHRSSYPNDRHRYFDPYRDYHRRREEEKKLRKLLEDHETKAREKKNIQDYVSEHLIELLERHLNVSSAGKEEEAVCVTVEFDTLENEFLIKFSAVRE